MAGGAEIMRSWSKTHVPAANTQATITQPAPGQGKKLVCTGLTVAFAAGAAAPTATTATVSLIDGATGGTTFLWQMTLGVVATAGATNGHSRPGKWVASHNTALTLEFSAAGGANTLESVSMEGYIEDDVVRV